MPEFEFEWFHDEILEKIDEVVEGKIKKLMIFLHPRIGKTEIVSKRLPTYFLGKNPDKNVIAASHTLDFATDLGRKARRIAKDDRFAHVFPEFKLSDDKSQAGDWDTTKGGGYYCAGVGSTVIGRGFNLGIIDDPIKSREKAESLTERNKVYDWYRSDFLTRRDPKDARIILMHQRWHEDDLAGRLLEEEGDDWVVLSYPAINEKGEPLSNKRGFGLDFYESVKKDGIREFESMYQQDPVRAGGETFKKQDFRYYAMSDLKLEEFVFSVSVDPAFSSRDESDDTAIITTARHKTTGDFYILDIFGETILPSQAYEYIITTVEKYKSMGMNLDFISIEDVAINEDQREFIKGFNNRCKDSGKYYTIIPFKPQGQGKKLDRIKYTLEPVINRHAIYFPIEKDKHSVELITQFLKFPGLRKDDLIDCLAQNVHVWQDRKTTSDTTSAIRELRRKIDVRR